MGRSPLARLGTALLILTLVGACQPTEPPDQSEMTATHKQNTIPITGSKPTIYYRPALELGELFEDVQMQRVFADSKTFVDSMPRMQAAAILDRYRQARDQPNFDLAEFVLQHFDVPTTDSVEFELDPDLSMEEHLRQHWDYLTREADAVEGISSLIPLPNPYIVPGGRFREIYYWDSYFTMHGLAASNEHELLKSMLDNFAWLVDEVGHIPNGNRSYYLSRSQPPFFAAMVSLYRDLYGDKAAAAYLPQLEREYGFWMDGAEELEPGEAHRRAVRLADGSLLNRYYDDLSTPRPESYREDVRTAHATEPDVRPQLYRDIRAAAESGWDFSSRWMSEEDDLATIQTTEIVPVDLNSLLYHLEQVISELAGVAGQQEKSLQFAQKAAARKIAVDKWLWDAESGLYRDYHLAQQAHTPVASLAMVYPLYFQLASDQQAAAVKQQLESQFLMPGGLVTTLNDTGEQWDYPNGWAPLQWLAIKGLSHYGHEKLSDEVAKRWLALNRQVFQNTGRMMEKYNVVDLDLPAGGGEYPLQDGFGWTNGVVLAIKARE
jgi:alpha,alpha-trehalase